MSENSIIAICILVAATITILALTGHRIRLHVEQQGIWLTWERAQRK